jgi:RNA polymerase sigma factor (sigma-70 family)
VEELLLAWIETCSSLENTPVEKRPQSRLSGRIRQVVSTLELRTESDQELLQSFVGQRDEAAFAAVIRRHGPMVLRVALRTLQNEHDAEDVFQATFLILSQKAHTLRRQESLGSWLYGIAYRLALKAKATAGERRNREHRVTATPAATPLAQITVREAQTILDEELNRLPQKLREPVVLCCLEGLARDEAAQRIGCPASVLKSRLEQGRERLRQRLITRGLTLPCGLGVFLLLEGAAAAIVPPALIGSTTQAAMTIAAREAASAVVSAKVAALTEGVLRTMFLTKIKIATVAMLVGMMALGGGMVTYRTAAAQGDKPAIASDKPPAAEKPVEPAANPEPEKDKEAFTSWGKEIGGLQAGLGFHPGQKRAYHHGETVELVVRVRNVGKEKVKFEYLSAYFAETPPTVTDAEAKLARFPSAEGEQAPKRVDLAPGKEIEIYELKFKLRPDSKDQQLLGSILRNYVGPDSLWGLGTVRVQYERLSSADIDKILSKLATGKLELEIKSEPPAENEKKAPDAPVPAAKDDKKTLQGIWKGEIVELAGRPFVEKVELHVDGDQLTLRGPYWGTGLSVGPPVDNQFTFKVKSSKPLAEIDMTRKPDPDDNAPRVVLGVYVVEGDTLRVCLGLENKVRPKELKTSADTRSEVMLVLKRTVGAKWGELPKDDAVPVEPKAAPEKKERAKEGFTAWGNEIAGLQAGLGFPPGQNRAYSHGETVKLVVRVRNVSMEDVKFQYLRQFFIETSPAVTDANGKPVTLPTVTAFGLHIPVEVTLAPGKEIDLYESKFEFRPASEALLPRGPYTTKQSDRFSTLYGTGKFQIQYERVFGNSSSGAFKPDPTLAKLATGKLELEIKSEPPPAIERKDVPHPEDGRKNPAAKHDFTNLQRLATALENYNYPEDIATRITVWCQGGGKGNSVQVTDAKTLDVAAACHSIVDGHDDKERLDLENVAVMSADSRTIRFVNIKEKFAANKPFGLLVNRGELVMVLQLRKD